MSAFAGRQFHNQPEDSHQHRFLADLWREVRAQTGGRIDITVHARNAGVAGSDPRVLEMLVEGEVEFATMMGPLIAAKVPAAEVQGVPFAFTNSVQIHQALDGALGDYLRREMATHGIYALPCGTLENGFRQICSVSKRVRALDDLAGYRVRVPAGRIFADLFTALGATPVAINIDGLYAALESGAVDGHENPLAITEVNHLYRVTRHVALTNHVWSGFNLIANLAFWRALPQDAQEIIHRAVKTHVARQRAYTVELNRALEQRLLERGMTVEPIDVAPLRARLAAGFYRRCREQVGSEAWHLLQAAGGAVPQ
jgi:tripartite ATP-independent transporter DctP family solute receptor